MAPAKTRRRHQSRASTISVTSTNLNSTHQQSADGSYGLQQPFDNQMYHYTPEEKMIAQVAHHLQNPNSYALDPSLEQETHQALDFPNVDQFVQDLKNATASHDEDVLQEADTHMLNTANGGPVQDSREQGQDEAMATKKKRNPGASLANELELRRLWRENELRDLSSIADELRGNDSGPQSERWKQVFAMLWLNGACKRSTEAIPRGRVYSHYAVKCSEKRVSVLNPASFGKLVRVVFPGIETRRLGVRGESKYHYCGLSLEGVEESALVAEESMQLDNHVSQGEFSFGDPSGRSQFPVDTAAFPSPGMSQGPPQENYGVGNSLPSGSLFHDKQVVPHDINAGNTTPGLLNTLDRLLYFDLAPAPPFRDNEPIDLPSILPYVPPLTDPDTSSALTALYRSHCTSLIDQIRYCREKPFFHLFTSFHGTLTLPVQKLLAHPSVAPWILECDWLMYQKMTRVVAPLIHQVLPVAVSATFQRISLMLTSHIKTTFKSHPPHVVEAKLIPATHFANLLHRELRVNEAAHAAANMLCNEANRNQMFEDWITHVNAMHVCESSLPCGHQKVLQILWTEIRGLVAPTEVSLDLKGPGGVTDDVPARGEFEYPSIEDNDMETVLDRWSAFLNTLPARFPNASPSLLIRCLDAVSTAALRDITMSGSKSFGSWWITKVWLDETFTFMAEKGGFLNQSPRGLINQRLLPVDANSQTPLPGFRKDIAHDDSGVSMHEDLNMEKYGFVSDDMGASKGTTELSGDVVVC
ncbi:MAG: hypothetical protein M1829_005889 [Trizodia sp. TS-e1964]|nr:MAG: hypothetical protein M1829_005889 [Trizodia sp. TS-e1964]